MCRTQAYSDYVICFPCEYIEDFMTRKGHLEKQAAKEAAAAAVKEVFEAYYKNCPEGLQFAQELAATTAAAVAKSRKERQQKRAAGEKILVLPEVL
ncbi:Transcription factor IIIB 90 kDa subunit [Melia azedarach]|uniref:Transcription factor IIIB 90 kDa subunit n=1 Tax=Melia azedarach TaxID=155640 RepID=A0ACC1YC52_MELAZ|nr:Transcription factor IIIB 90 kDa subunit [Melia azedarach]